MGSPVGRCDDGRYGPVHNNKKRHKGSIHVLYKNAYGLPVLSISSEPCIQAKSLQSGDIGLQGSR